MPASLLDDPILSRFSAAVREAFANRPNGSCSSARGRAATTSPMPTTTSPCSSTACGAGSYRERTIFMHELRKDGRDL